MVNSERKIRVGVVFGGRSGEHEVSLRSAQSVMQALDPHKYDILPIGITKTGQWLAGTTLLDEGEATHAQPVVLPATPQATTLMALGNGATNHAQNLVVDVILPVLHGPYGEDGTIQGLLELANVAYVGAGVMGSAVSMDKAIFKQLMVAHGLPVLPWRLVLSHTFHSDPDQVLDTLELAFVYPMFTKPANLGSSVGISKCHHRAELAAGLTEAARYDRRLVVEQGRVVRELEVAILGNDDPIASVVGEVRPRREFYDYIAKYVSDDSELLIPAPLSETQATAVRNLALRAYRAVDCRGLGRVDLLLDCETEAVYLNEINTIPGFTSISMYPKLWEATGLPYSELLDKLVALALEHHEVKNRLATSFAITDDE